MHNQTTVVIIPHMTLTLTRSDARYDATSTSRIPLCDSRGMVESGEGSACSRDLTCMCETCIGLDVATVDAIVRGESSARLPRISARLASVARPVATVAGTWFALATVLATGVSVGVIIGQMAASL